LSRQEPAGLQKKAENLVSYEAPGLTEYPHGESRESGLARRKLQKTNTATPDPTL
jgi:hypothetical protein